MVQDYLFSLFDTDYLLNETGDPKQDEENRYRLKMLRYFSILPAEDIDIPDLCQLYAIPDDKKQFFENILDDLKQSGWLQHKKRPTATASYLFDIYYKMHQLIQEVVYDRLHPDAYNCEDLVEQLTRLLRGERHRVITYKSRTDFMIKKLLLLDELRNQRGIVN